LYLPRSYQPPPPAAETPARPAAPAPARGPGSGVRGAEDSSPTPASRPPAPEHRPADEVQDDRDRIRPGDRVLLVVENDAKFARILLQMAREKGFKGLVAGRGDTALALARQFKPDAVTLDLRLPDTDGLVVLQSLKQDLATRHIPVHIISVRDERQRGLRLGAIAQLKKPVTAQAL